jgi:hypothetical protein
MTSKNSKDKPELEPIAPETTILKINIKTTGDLITKEYDLIPFHPNMADLRDLSNNSYIFFPTFAKITMKDLQKAGVGQDYPKIFTDLDKYVKLIKYVTSPEKEEDNTLLTNTSQVKNYATSVTQNIMNGLSEDNTVSLQKNEPLTEEEIITNNIELIRQVFLPFKSHFFILGNDYVIGQSKYIPTYIASEKLNKELSSDTKKIPLAYTVKFELQLLDAVNNPDAGDFMKMTCKAKKANIKNDMVNIFGMNLGKAPEAKVAMPSILNTSQTTKNRKFGKLQKEWENRNRYMSELERNESRKNMTPLQKKMADYDKQLEEYKKIPPLWLKETDELDQKYDNFIIDMVQLWQEMDDIKSNNENESKFRQDMLDAVETKMKALIYKLLEGGKDEYLDTEERTIKEIIEEIIIKRNKKDVEDYIKNVYNKTDNKKTTLLYDTKQNEQRSIDDKYVMALKKETVLDDKKEDLKVLEEEEMTLRSKYDNFFKTGDKYNVEYVKNELTKVQTDIRKKRTDIKIIEDKYNAIAKKWYEERKKNKIMKDNIENEKTKDEKKNENEFNKEKLKKKLEEIKKIKEEYWIALFKEDEKNVDLLRDEIKKYEKKDRPFNDSLTLKQELDTLEKEYLDIARKSNYKNKTEGLINLLNDDLLHYKAILNEKKRDRKNIENTMSESLYKQKKYGIVKDEEITDNKEEYKGKLEKNKIYLEKIKEIIAVYEKYIQELKKMTEESEEKFEEEKKEKFETELNDIKQKYINKREELKKSSIKNTSIKPEENDSTIDRELEISGGNKIRRKNTQKKYTQKKNSNKRKRKTKRYNLRRIKHKTIRKRKELKKHMRKKKRTMRRRT